MSAVTIHETPAVSPRAEKQPGYAVPIYVWELPVRITHWLIVFSIVTLAATGFYIGHPLFVVAGEARARFVTGTFRIVHLYAAIVFSCAVLTRIAWMFMGNRYARWNQLIPTTRARFKALLGTIAFYLAIRKKAPPVIGHNPGAGGAYVGIFGLYLFEILSGLILYGAAHTNLAVFRFLTGVGERTVGLALLRWGHHVVMWLLLAFVVQHVYSSVLMSIVDRNATLESIFSGWKFIDEAEIEENEKNT